MHIFIKVGGRLRGEKLSYLSIYLLYNLPITFSKIFSLATLARLRFILHLKNASMQCALPTQFIFVFIFCVIISDCQLPKFTENTHIIAQNRIAYKMS